jgi:hypothetical protein
LVDSAVPEIGDEEVACSIDRHAIGRTDAAAKRDDGRRRRNVAVDGQNFFYGIVAGIGDIDVAVAIQC